MLDDIKFTLLDDACDFNQGNFVVASDLDVPHPGGTAWQKIAEYFKKELCQSKCSQNFSDKASRQKRHAPSKVDTEAGEEKHLATGRSNISEMRGEQRPTTIVNERFA